MKDKNIDRHNRKILEEMLGEEKPKRKQVTVVPKTVSSEGELKKGTEDIRRAYFKNWYTSCKDIYNKERRRKRKENKKGR